MMFSYTKKFNRINTQQLLENNNYNNEPSFFWGNNKSNELLIGIGCNEEIELLNSNDLDSVHSEITKKLNTITDLTPEMNMKPKFFGGYKFNTEINKKNNWDNFPNGYFMLPKYIIMSNQDNTFITLISKSNKENIATIDEFAKKIINNNDMQIAKQKNKLYAKYLDDIDCKSNYLKIINQILSDIKKGSINKVVISKLKKISIKGEFNLSKAIQQLQNSYPQCINFYIHLPNRGTFLGSTPERLIKKNNTQIISEAIAGTFKRGLNMKEDLILENQIKEDLKNLEEHNLVIKEIAHILNPLLKNIVISKSPHILKLKNVQHLITNITGELKKNINILKLVKMIHPTPAVSGYPVDKAKKLIDKYEKHDRGWYSGPIGWIDSSGDGDFCVGIRSSFINNNIIQLFSGGGIVLNSIPEEEWVETELKMKPILEIIENNDQ